MAHGSLTRRDPVTGSADSLDDGGANLAKQPPQDLARRRVAGAEGAASGA
ncbi:MAG: hypothetical protein ACXVRZ_04160 [Gaiellaceae bacterium]